MLGPGGWVLVADLLSGIARTGTRITREELETVVAECVKERFAFDEAGTRIRANQGHSTEVELLLEQVEPPAEIYHGTPERNVAVILRDGLSKMARHHVHLSLDQTTATKVGSRRGKPIILVVGAAGMWAAGHVFYRSANGVWLVDHVPAGYLRVQ